MTQVNELRRKEIQLQIQNDHSSTWLGRCISWITPKNILLFVNIGALVTAITSIDWTNVEVPYDATVHFATIVALILPSYAKRKTAEILNLFREIWTLYGLATGDTVVAPLPAVIDSLMHRNNRYALQ